MLFLFLDFEAAIASAPAEAMAVCLALALFVLHDCVLQHFATLKTSGVRMKRQFLPDLEGLKMSLVVCIRDGANDWPTLWKSLKEQESIHWELVLVDDASSDNLQMLWSEAKKEEVNFPVQWLTMKTSRPGKKDALQMGIHHAQAPIIAVTDADCIPNGSLWLRNLCAEFNQGADGVLGVSFPRAKQGRGLLGACQRLDALRIARSYVAWAQWGLPYMGVGRNMAYKKELFQGFQGHEDLPSGDDDLLVQSWLVRKDICIVPVIDRCTQTDTRMPSTWSAWSRQKQRHWQTAWRYSFQHKIGLLFPKISNLIWWLSLSAWLWTASKEGVLHIVLWIVGALCLGRWGVSMLNFRSFAKACGTPSSWYWLGWVQPILDAWIGWQALVSRGARKSNTWN